MNPIYRTAPFLPEAETVVSKIMLTANNETALICRDLLFYPGGGGQPAETTGTVYLRGHAYPVKTLNKLQGDVQIILYERLPYHHELRKGEPITQHLDMTFRLRASKTHSVQHTLGAACRLTLRGYRYETLGMEIYHDLSRCEMRFQTDVTLTNSIVDNIAGLARTAIASDLPIRTEYYESIEAVRDKFGEAFRINPTLTEWRSNRLRTVIIGEENMPLQDVCFCGGTHIHSLTEAEDFQITDFGTEPDGKESYLIFRCTT